MEKQIGRNDPCWCGSGRKYKKCHLNRQAEKALPWQVLASDIRKAFSVKECLHPLASPRTCRKMISAHTIQRGTALRSSADPTGHVSTFYGRLPEHPLTPRRVGLRAASTFAGFCARHDNDTFAPLERSNFTASDEQCFLLAYRAQCHEVYQKQSSERAGGELRDGLDRGQAPDAQRLIQAQLLAQDLGVRKGLADMRKLKARMDYELVRRHFTEWKRILVCFEAPTSVVSTGVPTPNRGLSGDPLQVLHNFDDRLQPLYLATVASQAGDGGAVLLMWRPEDSAPARFVAELEGLPYDELTSVIVQFMFAYIENTYFSSAWWSSLSQILKSHIARLGIMDNPYYYRWTYLHELIAPWKVTAIQRK